uniref:Uncharacterized protein n=1 Tax=Arundo donax TaxID=35708 RepID=A0A0A9CHS5_ARUDO
MLEPNLCAIETFSKIFEEVFFHAIMVDSLNIYVCIIFNHQFNHQVHIMWDDRLIVNLNAILYGSYSVLWPGISDMTIL